MSRKIYIVARTFKIEGLFAIVNSVINHCEYAYDNGYIPIVDMKHYANQYFKDGRIFKDNSWEYFFEQPSGIGLDDIQDEDEIVISKNLHVLDVSTSLFLGDFPLIMQL